MEAATAAATQPAPPDHLGRGPFLDTLEQNIDTLAALSSEKLATPRVLAIDAAWGNGKTWVAKELIRRLQAQEDRKVVAIDVFRYDHHDDPFSVIASAIYTTLRPKGAIKTRFLSTAGAVLKSAAPIAAKVAIAMGTRAIGLSPDGADEAIKEVIDGATEATSDYSEKAVEKLFESYSDTERIQTNFIAMLGSVTSKLKHPLVIVVDELDRCRPSFALEVLERIKHLFGANNVVFVLFWNSHSIHESIRHTYGQGTDAPDYLAKFVAFSVPLELPLVPGRSVGRRFSTFVDAIVNERIPRGFDLLDFREAFREAAGVLNPSLRHLEKAIQLAAHLEIINSEQWSEFSTYLLLLRTIDERRYDRLVRLEPHQVTHELDLFARAYENHEGRIHLVDAVLGYAQDRAKFRTIAQGLKTGTHSRNTLSERQKQILDRSDSGEMVRLFERHAAVLTQLLTNRRRP